MDYTLRPRSLGTLLDNTFDIYRRNFFLFAGISAIPSGISLLFQLAWIGFVVPPKGTAIIAGSSWIVIGVALTAVLGWFATLFVNSVVTAATTSEDAEKLMISIQRLR